ncbi:Lipopolysaccharide biosynthesis protein, LPS:glycosyltransferase [Micromonospora haikouensis]|uniref:Lipopolysaccharide biosynthesis protein, LPS:glycosyltransferase n=1 Tax=Micromonospora haikouensis TaxID=686309 RepID=A0A1C4X0M4_9ACTN|nr:glycosyltransferase family 8 protein [Micromonospora haikouensis]SCF02023.1 Lipopolysaccharide biosynthesis protein, LPS:glycosyltransferase [Micromonospora haikouensis]
MELTLTFDAAYAAHAAVVMASVAESNPGQAVRYWLIAADDVSPSARAALTRAAGPDAGVEYLRVDTSVVNLPKGSDPVMAYLSPAMYLRLLVPAALPDEVRRVLYLDCDTMCTNSLAPLFDVDMGGAPLGAVRDPFNRRLLDMGGIPGLAEYRDLDPYALYFNSGVLLIDVARWKECEVTEKSLAYLARHAHESRYPDQDALNYAVYGNWLRLPRQWNDLMAWRLEPEFGGKLSDSAVIHPAGPIKPWQPGFPKGARRDLYWRHRRRNGGLVATTRR